MILVVCLFDRWVLMICSLEQLHVHRDIRSSLEHYGLTRGLAPVLTIALRKIPKSLAPQMIRKLGG